MTLHALRSWSAFLGLAAAFVFPTAINAGEIVVEKSTMPIPFLIPAQAETPETVDSILEASAVEPIGDGKYLLVAHDKAPGMYVVEAASGRVLTKNLLSSVFPTGEKADPKWEGFARDDQGWYYAAGTHSGKTAEQRAQRAHIVRFRFRFKESSAGAIPVIDDSTARRWTVAKSLDSALRAEGLTAEAIAKGKIEGLSIRQIPGANGGPSRNELTIGLREPDDLVRVFATDLTTLPAADADLPLTRLFTFDAGKREGVPSTLTSLCFVPRWDGFFVLTTTEDLQNAFHGNTLWFVPSSTIQPGSKLITPERIHDFEVAMKSEGIADLPATRDENALHLLVTFDNDGHTTHIPSRFQVLRLRRTK